MEETYTPTTVETGKDSHMWLIISDFFYIFNIFLQKYTLYNEMPEDKKIARMLTEEYIYSWHNYYKMIVWALGS
jgi:hypothetical protein